MNSRIVFFTLISTFLLLGLVVAAASAQTRTVGVSVGNTFRCSVTVSWHSTDPSATFPSNLVDFNNTLWSEITITSIFGTTITGNITSHYKNGTEITTGGWVDVNTGNNVNLKESFISADLTAGDSEYTSSPYNTHIINETVTRTYLGVGRDTNHLGYAYPEGSTNLYWDKTTGFLVEVLVESTSHTFGYITTWSLDVQITSSNVWIVPEFSTWTPALLMLIALTSATMVIAKQRQPKGAFR
jgi:hypothetical protein